MTRTPILALCALLWSLAVATVTSPAAAQTAHAADNPAPTAPEPRFQYRKGFHKTAFYLTMRDSVRIAADLYLPRGHKPSEKLPTVLFLSRYVRSIQAIPILRFLKPYITTTVSLNEVQYYVRHGYAVMIVDTRGSGASTGVRKMEMHPDEVADTREIADWIVAQPWSNGRIGTSGVSYLGTTSLLALANQHPAIRAAIPRHSIFDLYADLTFVNGVPQADFVRTWGTTTRSLDANNFEPFAGKLHKLLSGITPVQGDRGMRLRNEAIAMHRNNFDFVREFPKVKFRNHTHPVLLNSVDDYSVHSYWPRIQKTRPAIFWYSGWYDGALSNSSLKGFYNSPAGTARLRMGPWDHGPRENASPYSPTRKVTWNQLREFRAFFDLHLKDLNTGELPTQPVQYYTIGEEVWHGAETWPPAGFRPDTLWFTPNRTLNTSPPPQEQTLAYTVDTTASSGLSVRYNSQTQLFRKGPIGYPDRAKRDSLNLVLDGPVLERDVEITGHPVVTLHTTSDATDAQLFVYLEEVLPDGRVNYITEGLFRARHRKPDANPIYRAPFPQHSFRIEDDSPLTPGQPAELTFDLLGVSYLVRKGSRLRISIAGADKDHFSTLPDGERPTVLQFGVGGTQASHVVLPVKGR